MYICARPRSFKKINMKNKKLTINENQKKIMEMNNQCTRHLAFTLTRIINSSKRKKNYLIMCQSVRNIKTAR